MLEKRAIHRYVGSSPRKMRLVIDLIRGKSVDEALTILHFSTKHAARIAEKVLRSAVSNIHNTDEGTRLDTTDMFVKEAYVDGGPSMKRVLPAPMGRAYQILKRSNHVSITVAPKAKTAKQEAAKSTKSTAKTAKAAAPATKQA
ncbi:MAG TPA: 50S ribosomal protein L22 [Bacteroidota bacterium]|nr:50S ribosomal protein L22 [Bacteroidota bacterium]